MLSGRPPQRRGRSSTLIVMRAARIALLIPRALLPAEAATPRARRNAAATVTSTLPVQSVFDREQAMTPAQLIQRWTSMVAKASRRFGTPVAWINAVMRVESVVGLGMNEHRGRRWRGLRPEFSRLFRFLRESIVSVGQFCQNRPLGVITRVFCLLAQFGRALTVKMWRLRF
jgi:hypothetical protein